MPPAALTHDRLLAFLRRSRLCVEASVSPSGAPQAAVVGFAVTETLEFIFDTLASTRKLANLRANPRTSLVVGWGEGDDERTVQLEGLADEPAGLELARLTEVYYRVFPDGRARLGWPGLTYVRVRPTWLRYSDFRPDSQCVLELDEAGLAQLKSDGGR